MTPSSHPVLSFPPRDVLCRVVRSCAALILVLTALTGCSRPELEGGSVRVQVEGPDLSMVRLEPSLTLQLRVLGVDNLDRLTVNDILVTRSDGGGRFEVTIQLEEGLNALAIAVEAQGDDAVQRDTAYALYLPLQTSDLTGTQLPEERSGHTATALPDGSTLIAGGSGASGMLATARRVTESGFTYTPSDETIALRAPRSGHTASLLPDGRVLLLGGRGREPDGGHTDAEVIDPAAGTSSPVRVTRNGVAANIERAKHTAEVLTRGGTTAIYLYGGIVPTNSGEVPSSTVDILIWDGENDALRILSPPSGAGTFEALSEHVQIPLSNADGEHESLVVGLSGGGAAVGFRFVFGPPTLQYPFSVARETTPAPPQPHRGAAGAQVGDGLILLAGGTDAEGAVSQAVSIYAAEADRFFTVPEQAGAILRTPRTAAAATLQPSGRILLTGGRNASGASLRALSLILPRE